MESNKDPPKIEDSTSFSWFTVRTYFSKKQLELFLDYRCRSMIQHFAYCYHDSDYKENGQLVEPHFHIVIKLFRPRTLEAVEKWFSGYHDEKGMEITYKVIPLSGRQDITNQYEYLLHLTTRARSEGKHMYSVEERIVDDVDFWEPYSFKFSQQNLMQAVFRICSGELTLRSACFEYGRDFILHYGVIKSLVQDIAKEEVNYLGGKKDE